MSRRTHPKKGAKVKLARGHTPEEIAASGELMDVLENPKYLGQQLEIYWLDNYIWVVVSAINPDRFITAYKSRKLKRRYGK